MLRCQQLEMLSLSATGALVGCQARLRSILSQIDVVNDPEESMNVNAQLDRGLFVRRIMSLAIRPCPLRAAHNLTDLRKAIHALSEHLAAEFAYGNWFDSFFDSIYIVFFFIFELLFIR